MNKTELIDKIAAGAGLTKVDAKKALDATVDAIKAALKKGDKVQLIGFGTFDVVKKPAREGINPATKQKIKIAAKKVAKFKGLLSSRLALSSLTLSTNNSCKEKIKRATPLVQSSFRFTNNKPIPRLHLSIQLIW